MLSPVLALKSPIEATGTMIAQRRGTEWQFLKCPQNAQKRWARGVTHLGEGLTDTHQALDLGLTNNKAGTVLQDFNFRSYERETGGSRVQG